MNTFLTVLLLLVAGPVAFVSTLLWLVILTGFLSDFFRAK